VKEAVVTLAGLIGALSILWFIVASVAGVSIIIFATGSMAPTIPTGSAALVREVPASEIDVGDVVTVQRPGSRLPVTHRVVSVSPDPDAADGRILVLRGDANVSNDTFPYRVTEAKVVVAAIPVLGTILAIAGRPAVTGVLTIVVAALVVWAFWPTRRSAHRAPTGSGP
jgi:signal peptidase